MQLPDHVQNLPAYVPGESVESLAARLGRSPESIIKLDANGPVIEARGRERSNHDHHGMLREPAKKGITGDNLSNASDKVHHDSHQLPGRPVGLGPFVQIQTHPEQHAGQVAQVPGPRAEPVRE